MELTPKDVYQQSIDQQRIVITGTQRSRLASFIVAIFNAYQRPYNHCVNGVLTKMKGAPLTIIESSVSSETLDYKHHVLLLSPTENTLDQLAILLDATSKSGLIIYPETDSSIKSIAGKERADVQIVPYKSIAHEVTNGKVVLVTSTKEKFPIKLRTADDLLLLAAAKELVRKTGISSGEFYKAASALE